MTPAERRNAGTRLCRRLAKDVRAIAPPGTGGWSRAWEIVAQADADFMLALTTWEATGDAAAKEPLREAYFQVLEAWRCAAAEYEREQATRR